MKSVLYISNITVPYRIEFFNQLSQQCDLTVVYERSQSKNREQSWMDAHKILYRHFFLDGIKVGNENSFSFRILKYIFGKYDAIVIGCFNSPVQMFAILVMKMLRKRYYLNVDGEIFTPENPIKKRIRNFFLKGAKGYFCAGTESANSLYGVTKSNNIVSYKFSSMSKKEIEKAIQSSNLKRNNTILVVGQYEEYKGLDIAAQVAKKNPEMQFMFVGMSNKKEAFLQYLRDNAISNIEVFPFLKKEELQEAYQTSRILILPSRQECWGLVINEGAIYGIPIVSTWGSGAARDFLKGKYECCLAQADNVDDLSDTLVALNGWSENDLKEYSVYLQTKSQEYCIEENVRRHVEGLDL